jgi:PPOX class probable F420-dependent enzyme
VTSPASNLRGTKTSVLTTYKGHGAPVPTPVRVAVVGGRVYFRTWHTAWKAKRLANNPEVEGAPSTLRGAPTGPAVRARARLAWWEQGPIRSARSRASTPFLQALLVPLTHRLMRYRALHDEL